MGFVECWVAFEGGSFFFQSLVLRPEVGIFLIECLCSMEGGCELGVDTA